MATTPNTFISIFFVFVLRSVIPKNVDGRSSSSVAVIEDIESALEETTKTARNKSKASPTDDDFIFVTPMSAVRSGKLTPNGGRALSIESFISCDTASISTTDDGSIKSKRKRVRKRKKKDATDEQIGTASDHEAEASNAVMRPNPFAVQAIAAKTNTSNNHVR